MTMLLTLHVLTLEEGAILPGLYTYARFQVLLPLGPDMSCHLHASRCPLRVLGHAKIALHKHHHSA